MRWILFVVLLMPVVLYAQADINQSVEIDGIHVKNSINNNQNKIILTSSSINQISNSFASEISKQDTLHTNKRKSPTTAFVLSLIGGATILPGLGQHYNGEHNKGLLMGAVWYAGWIIAAGTESRDSEKTGRAVGVPLVCTAFIWSCIDAPISAKKINKRYSEQNTYGRMLGFHKKQFTYGLSLSVDNGAIGPNLTLYF